MIQKLVILGILKANPASGYDIKKIIEKELGLFSSLETHSIYYPLKKMEQVGLIKKREVQGETHLKKYMYSITPKGEREFYGLCQEALSSEKRPFIDIDIPLYFLPYLDRKEVIARLRLRKRFLEKARQWLMAKLAIDQEFPNHQRLLLKHHLNLLNAEEEFVREILSAIKTSHS
jgi:DNA-binding PadR family transcriptional regulator